MNLTLDERTKILDKVCRLVEIKHFDPGMNGVDWNALAQEPKGADRCVYRTGFRHAGMRDILAQHAINATMQPIAVNGSERWMFQDVHQSGPAYSAGMRPGDLLLGNSCAIPMEPHSYEIVPLGTFAGVRQHWRPLRTGSFCRLHSGR